VDLAPISPVVAPTDEEATGYAPDLSRLRRMFDDARNGMQDARRDSEKSRDYYDSDQLTPDERRKLRDRGQPDIVINRIRPGVDGVLGVVEQGKSSPRGLARNPAGEESADVASQTLRYIADTTHFDQTRMDCLENYLIEGTCAVIVEAGPDDVTVTQIRWEEYACDPRARRPDAKDARYHCIAKWMYLDDLQAIYPEAVSGANEFLTNGLTTGMFSDESWDDRPDNLTPWIDTKAKRIMVVESYYQEAGNWLRCVFYAGGVLEAQESPYTDDNGRPCCPIEVASYGVDRKNRRYGMVKSMRDIQDEVNARRQRALFLSVARQIQPIDGNTQVIDVDLARKEAANPAGVFPLGYQVVPNSDQSAAALTLLQEAKSELERMSVNPALVGRAAGDASGRAVLARQQAGMTELARPLGRFDNFVERVYKQMWARAKQFWTAPKWIRVTNDIGATQHVLVNDPRPPEAKGPDGQPLQSAPVVDMQGQPVPQQNHLAKMDVDIVLETVPDTATIAAEQFSELLRLIGTNPMWMQALTLPDIIEMSSLPKKREIIDKITERQQQAAQQQAQAQAQQQEMARAAFDTERTKTFSEIAKNEATAKLTTAKAIETAAHVHMGVDQHLNPPPGPTGDNGPPPNGR
jgi:hypothetical protein